MAFKLKYEESKLGKNMEALPAKFNAMVLMFAVTKAKELESSMKKNRPWTDRTNNAKVLLNTKVSQLNPTVVRITLAHGVEYGIWLELAHNKNYAVILPTIMRESPKILQDFTGLIEGAKVPY